MQEAKAAAAATFGFYGAEQVPPPAAICSSRSHAHRADNIWLIDRVTEEIVAKSYQTNRSNTHQALDFTSNREQASSRIKRQPNNNIKHFISCLQQPAIEFSVYAHDATSSCLKTRQ